MELLKQYLKNSINKIFIILFTFISLIDCNRLPKFGEINENFPHGRGFTLQRFEFIDPQLDNLIQDVKNNTEIKNRIKKTENVILLNLIINDSSEIKLGITLVDIDDVAKRHIFNTTQRIVGYVALKSDTLIVLSNAHSQFDFEVNFYKFIRPTSDTKYFDYIYFPDDLYKVDEKGIPLPPPLYDPLFYSYIYKNNEFILTDGGE